MAKAKKRVTAPKRSASAKPAKPPKAAGMESLLKSLDRRLQGLEAVLKAGVTPAAVEPGPGLIVSLDKGESRVLEAYGRRRSVEAGSQLFSEGDVGDEMFIVVEGALEIFKKDFLGDLRLAEIRPGGIVGEMALIEGKPRSANVRALQAGVVLALSRAGYQRLKEEQPRIATKLQEELLQLFSNRLRQTTDKMLGQV